LHLGFGINFVYEVPKLSYNDFIIDYACESYKQPSCQDAISYRHNTIPGSKRGIAAPSKSYTRKQDGSSTTEEAFPLA
jgi:hypothetical protein